MFEMLKRGFTKLQNKPIEIPMSKIRDNHWRLIGIEEQTHDDYCVHVKDLYVLQNRDGDIKKVEKYNYVKMEQMGLITD